MSQAIAAEPPGRMWLLAAIVGAAGIGRLLGAVSAPLVFDEYQWLEVVDDISLVPGRVSLPLHGAQHPPAQAYWAALGTALFGRNLLGYRIASVVLGTLLTYLTYRLGRLYFGARVGLVAAALVASNEYLLGISRLCTEKTYLTFSLLALLAFERALERRTARAFALAGGAFGLGALTCQRLLLWVPIFLLWLWRRDPALLRSSAARWGVLAFALVVAPDWIWNLMNPDPGESPLSRGILWQLSRLGLGSWSWGPTALYFRPLAGLAVEPGVVSEYPAMTALPGMLLLLAALVSVVALRSDRARFLLVLGWSPFLFFSLLAGGTGEFWWADLSIVPFALLTALLLDSLPRARSAVLVTAVGLCAAAAFPVATARENCFPGVWMQSPQLDLNSCRSFQAALVVENTQRDHQGLTRVAAWSLPARAVYRETFANYHRDRLVALDEARAGPPAQRRWIQQEIVWVEQELARFDAPAGARRR